jgi:predicted PurR-regulated permease PerM
MKRVPASIGSLGVGVVVVGALIFFMHWAAPVLVPIFLALFLTALATPGYRWLLTQRLPQPVCLLVIVITVLLTAAGLALLGFVSLARLLGYGTVSRRTRIKLPPGCRGCRTNLLWSGYRVNCATNLPASTWTRY